ncbi:MAG: type II toxin-antitoxin system RelE/ParE family toxin [Gammaproteobacteria bacterium]
MRVKWLRTALRNLEAEAEYIAQDNPAAAKRTVERVRAAVGGSRTIPPWVGPGVFQARRS